MHHSTQISFDAHFCLQTWRQSCKQIGAIAGKVRALPRKTAPKFSKLSPNSLCSITTPAGVLGSCLAAALVCGVLYEASSSAFHRSNLGSPCDVRLGSVCLSVTSVYCAYPLHLSFVHHPRMRTQCGTRSHVLMSFQVQISRDGQ